jgi:hypothetical protein
MTYVSAIRIDSNFLTGGRHPSFLNGSVRKLTQRTDSGWLTDVYRPLKGHFQCIRFWRENADESVFPSVTGFVPCRCSGAIADGKTDAKTDAKRPVETAFNRKELLFHSNHRSERDSNPFFLNIGPLSLTQPCTHF